MQSRTLFPARVADTISATWVGRRLRASKGDDGFFLLESIVSIAIITIIMAALTAFFTDTVHTTDLQRSKQTAVQVADAAIDSLRALPATDLVTGRDSASVTAQFSAASSVVQPWITLALMSRDYDGSATAGAGANAVVPTSAKTTTLNGTAYKVSKYIGSCSAPIGNSSSCLSTNPTGSGYVAYVRGVVAVEWPDSRCPSNTCTYVTATLITKSTTDPTFNLNQSPTPAPVAVSPGNQTSVVGDQISGVQLTMKAGTGVPTATWTTTSTLPAGITLNPDGTFSGSPTAATSALTITATLHDGFLRTSSVSFTWTVLGALSAPAPSAQNSTTGTAITPLTLTASGGSGTPYTWSDPNSTLPPGLTLTTSSNQGKITGTPTRAGTYPVTVTVKDSGNHTATVSWTWTVGYAQLVGTNPGTVTSTKGAAATLQLTASGGSGSVTWTASPLPTGLSVNGATGLISGTPTSAGTTSVTVTGTDTAANAVVTQTVSWSVVLPPTVAAPAAQSTTVGGAVNLQLTTTCPNSPCSYALVNGPSGLTISSTGLVSGTVTGSAGVFSTAKITVTDAANVSATSATFTWTVNTAPSMGTIATQTTYVNTAASLNVASFVSNGTAPYTYSATGLPSWLSINSSTGMITGTAPATKAVTTGITVTVKDASNLQASTSVKWIVTDLRLAIPDQWTSPGATVTAMDIDTYLSGGTTPYVSPYTVTVANLPSGIVYNTTSHIFSGTAPSTRMSAPMLVTVTDAQGASVTDSFTWYVSSLRLTIGDQVTAPNTAVNLPLDNYVTGGTATSITVSGQPTWLTYNTTTHVFAGTAPASAGPVSPVVITVQDSSGFSFAKTITWYVDDLRWSGVPTIWNTSRFSTVNVDMTPYDFGGTGPYTYTATGLPSNVKIDPVTGVITNSGWTATGTYMLTVTVTDATGASATSPVVTWTVS